MEFCPENPGELEILGKDFSEPYLDPAGLGREEPDPGYGPSLGKVLTGEVGGLRPRLEKNERIFTRNNGRLKWEFNKKRFQLIDNKIKPGGKKVSANYKKKIKMM